MAVERSKHSTLLSNYKSNYNLREGSDGFQKNSSLIFFRTHCPMLSQKREGMAKIFSRHALFFFEFVLSAIYTKVTIATIRVLPGLPTIPTLVQSRFRFLLGWFFKPTKQFFQQTHDYLFFQVPLGTATSWVVSHF